MMIRPADVAELRAELVDFLGNLDPESMKAVAEEMGGGVPDEWLSFHFEKSQKQARGLAQADLYYVSPEMSQLAIAAGTSLPEFTLDPEDVPTPYGLIFFDSPPLLDTDLDGEPSWAASWRPDGPGQLHIDWYDSAEAISVLIPDSKFGMAGAYRSGPRLQALSNTQVTYGQSGTYGEAYRGEPYSDARRSWLNSLKAAWLLMQQPLAAISDVEPDRAAKKRLRRAGHEPADVRVIELRRPKSSGEPGEGARDYQHQWIVRGHWRNHWHPKREVHRPVWIAPHVKGPEGAPMIGGEKVYAWKR